MATDLRERPVDVRTPEKQARRSHGSPRWPYAATALTLAVVAIAVTALLRQEAPPATTVEEWQANVAGMMTGVREGTGFREAPEPIAITHPVGLEYPGPTQTVGTIPGLENPEALATGVAAYVESARTGSREGSSSGTSAPATDRPPLGSTPYADGTLTELPQG